MKGENPLEWALDAVNKLDLRGKKVVVESHYDLPALVRLQKIAQVREPTYDENPREMGADEVSFFIKLIQTIQEKGGQVDAVDRSYNRFNVGTKRTLNLVRESRKREAFLLITGVIHAMQIRRVLGNNANVQYAVPTSLLSRLRTRKRSPLIEVRRLHKTFQKPKRKERLKRLFSYARK